MTDTPSGAYTDDTDQAATPFPSAGAAWYAVGVLLVAYTNSFIDRTILALLVPPIQADLGINDTAMSLLHGFAFAIFYTALGVPIARLSDRYARRRIILIGTAFWSVMTMLCGLARNFAQLFLTRVGVGVGEAALSPAAYSMIADLFPKDRLGRALGVYSTGVFFGAGLAFIIGGALVNALAEMPSIALPLLGPVEPWRATFILVGLPGIVIGLLMLTVAEPKRRGVAVSSDNGRFRETLAFMRRNRATLTCHFLGFSALAVIFNGFIAWSPTFFVRAFGYAPGDAGIALGWLILLAGPAGIITGGMLSDTFMRRGHTDGAMRAGMIGGVGLIVPAGLATLMPSPQLALGLFAVLFFFSSFPYGAAAAALQIITPNRMRAQLSALYLLVLNLIGIGLGPTVIAATSDYLLGGPQKLGLSMAIIGGVMAPAGAALLFFGLKPFRISAAEDPETT